MSDFVVKNGLQIGGGSSLKSGTIAGNATLDLTTGNFFSHTPTADTTFVFNNPPAAGKAHGFALKVTGVDIGSSYDLANASYDSVSLGGFGGSETPYQMSFKPDGTKMYIQGFSLFYLKEYNLSTAWDISTASFVQEVNLGSDEPTPQGLFIKPDGTKVYIVGVDFDRINEYDLSTAWDISTISYVQNFSVSSQMTNPNGLSFKPDGTKVFVSDVSSSDIYEYDLSTAWDISTASYNQNFSVSNTLRNLFFNPDGLSVFVAADGPNTIREYSLSTAWDVSTMSLVRSFSVATQDTSPYAVFFGNSGAKMYVSGGSTRTVYQYTTGTGPDIATLTYPASVAWPNGVPPTAPAVGETDVLTFYTEDGGTTYNGFQAGDAMQ
jgi:hypothetical protein